MNLIAMVKELGLVLGAVSACGYMAGYFSLRARAHALGTDPGFTLVDEAYVFAGFRLLLVTLVVLLLIAPLVFGARSAAQWVATHVGAKALACLEWTMLCALGLLTLFNLRILLSAGLLLLQSRSSSALASLDDAVLGAQSGTIWILAVTLLPALSGLWLHARIASAHGLFELILGLLIALQIFLLPVYHGALLADRDVRVLTRKPDGLPDLLEPLGVVDRTSEHVTLLGLSTRGGGALVVVALKDLERVGVARIASLRDFMKELVAAESHVNGAPANATLGDQTPNNTDAARANGSAPVAIQLKNNDGFFKQVFHQLGVTLEAIATLGESAVTAGELWEAQLDVTGRVARRRVGSATDLSWPVSAPCATSIYALRKGILVTVAKDGTLQELQDNTRWHKLLGVTPDGTVVGFALEDGKPVPALRSRDGAVAVGSPPAKPEEEKVVGKLLHETRSYAGGIELTVERSERGGRGFDVFLSRDGRTLNVSDSGDDSCGHASLTSDPLGVLYIRQPRF